MNRWNDMLAAVTLFDLSRDRMWVDFSLYYWIHDFLKQKMPSVS
jgi:hypothetical protein